MDMSLGRRVFVGQLPRHTKEHQLRIVLESYQFAVKHIKMGTGYAFVDIEDRLKRDYDTLLNVFKNIQVDGNVVKVEFCSSGPKSFISERRVNNNKVVVHNLPDRLSVTEVKQFLLDVSSQPITITQCDRANNKQMHKASYILQLNSPEEAQTVLNSINGLAYGDATLKVVPFAENHGGRYKYRSNSVHDFAPRNSSHGGVVSPPTPIYPFRFLVPTHLIGAIIGVNGHTIKKFQIESGARYIIVDVQQKDGRFPDEKPVTVLGSSESQICAMNKILTFLDELIVSRANRKAEASKLSKKAKSQSESSAGAYELCNGIKDAVNEQSQNTDQGQENLCDTMSAESSSVNDSTPDHLPIPDVISDSLLSCQNGPEVDSKQSVGKNHPNFPDAKSDFDNLPSPQSSKQDSPNSATSVTNLSQFGTQMGTEFKPPLTVKILTHDQLIGRLIGKGGSNLAGIKEKTDTKITIPNNNVVQLNASHNSNLSDHAIDSAMERLITIEGERHKTTEAARAMLIKLRSSYDRDVDHMKQQASMQSLYPTNGWSSHFGNPFMGAPPPSFAHQLMSPSTGGASDPFTLARLGAALPSAFPQIPTLMNAHGSAFLQSAAPLQNSYGASQLAAAAGSFSMPHITNNLLYEQLQIPEDQRRITVVGTPDSQWKAQWLIIEKLRTDGFTQGEWPIVTIELPIPVSMVGRIIGKQGKKSAQKKIRSIVQRGKTSPGMSNGFLPGFGDPHVNAFPNSSMIVTPGASSGNVSVSSMTSSKLGGAAVLAHSASQGGAVSGSVAAANSSVTSAGNVTSSPVINASAGTFAQF